MTFMRLVRTMVCALIAITLTVTLLCGSTFAVSGSDRMLIVPLKSQLYYTIVTNLVEVAGGRVEHYLSISNTLIIAVSDDILSAVSMSLLNSGYVWGLIDDLLTYVDIVCPIPALALGEDYYWHNEQILVPDAHQQGGQTGSNVRVAVLDTGIDGVHKNVEFHGRIVAEFNATNELTTGDLHGHGTHVAGLIAAASNNSGTIGVAPGAGLVVVRVGTALGAVWLSHVLKGLDWIAQNVEKHKIRVLNISLGFQDSGQQPAFSDKNHPLQQTIKYLVEKKGVITVASAGNRCDAGPKQDDGGGEDCKVPPPKCDDSKTGARYPAAYSEVIAVAATGKNSGITDYSLSANVAVAAPGGEADQEPLSSPKDSTRIVSTTKLGAYGVAYGTSQAAPIVTGSIALLLGQEPNLSRQQVITRIQQTATPLGKGEVGEINVWGIMMDGR
jgi:subtilisin family serine protease